MLEKGKISALQMSMMIYTAIIATAILFLPADLYDLAGRDIWISPIWSAVIGFLTLFISVRLNKFYPKDTIIQYSSYILGTFLGKIIGAIILLFYLQTTHQIIWQYGEFMIGYFLPKTPQIVLLGSITLICAFAVRGGVEVVGRLAGIIVPIFLLLFLSIVILLLHDINVKHLFPIMGKGIIPSMKGAIRLNHFFSEFLLLSFFLPFVTDKKKVAKWGMMSVLTLMMTMVVTNLITLIVLGEAIDNFEAPLMTAVKYIRIADFLSHLEALVITIWIAGAFIKICVFYYALVLGTAQLFNLSDYRPLVFPIGFLMILLAVWQIPNASAFNLYAQTVNPILGPFVQTVIPLFLILAFYMTKGKHQRRN